MRRPRQAAQEIQDEEAELSAGGHNKILVMKSFYHRPKYGFKRGYGNLFIISLSSCPTSTLRYDINMKASIAS